MNKISKKLLRVLVFIVSIFIITELVIVGPYLLSRLGFSVQQNGFFIQEGIPNPPQLEAPQGASVATLASTSSSVMDDTEWTVKKLTLKNGDVLVSRLDSTYEVPKIEGTTTYSLLMYKSTLSLINGENNPRTVLVSHDLPSKYISLLKINKNEDIVYYFNQPDGLGGYILYKIQPDLFSYNLKTGKETELSNPRKATDFNSSESYYDVSPDDTSIVFSRYNEKEKRFGIIVRNILTKKEVWIPTDTKAGFTISGNAQFSPDSKKILYWSHFNDPENEQFRINVYNLANNTNKILFDSQKNMKSGDPYIEEVNWISSDKIDLKMDDGSHKVLSV